MIYRDDDISVYTDLGTIQRIQDLFDGYNKIHTVTLLMKDLWGSRGVWEWVTTTPNLDIALHGWEHIDYSTMYDRDIRDHIGGSLDYWKVNLGRIGKEIPIKVMYPPWNKSSNILVDVCKEFGLEINTCIDTSKVYNFHWWEFVCGRNLDKLEKVLQNG